VQDVVDALPVEPWHEQLIGLSALEAVSFLIDAWMEIVAIDGVSPAATARPLRHDP
jgi:hypothetical protein